MRMLPAAARLWSRLFGVLLLPVQLFSKNLDRARAEREALDRALCVIERYQASHPDRIAASVAYYAFLSLVPLVLLASSVLGFVLAGDPAARLSLLSHISDVVPGSFAETIIDGVTSSRRSSGLFGIVFLLVAGTAWIDSLRAGIRSVWRAPEYEQNVVVKKLLDALSLGGLGLAFLISVGVSVAGTSASGLVLDTLTLEGALARAAAQALTLAVALASGFVLFLYVFARLPRTSSPWHRLVPAALLAAVGFELLKLVGTLYLTWVTRNSQLLGGALVGALATLVWMNLLARLTLFAAAWGAPPRPRRPRPESPLEDVAEEVCVPEQASVDSGRGRASSVGSEGSSSPDASGGKSQGGGRDSAVGLRFPTVS